MELDTVLRSKMHNHPLRNRIVAAFVAMTFIVSSVFSFVIFKVFHYVEEQTVSRELDHKLSYYIYDIRSNEHAVMQVLGVQIFASNSATHPIPEEFSHLKSGFTETVQANHALHAYRRVVNGIDYLVIQDQGNLEAYEHALYDGVVVGFILSVLAAALVGWLLAKRLAAPLIKLTEEVSERDLAKPSPAPLTTDYGNDEIGRLARAFDAAFAQLDMALQRERLFTSDVSHELRTSLMVIAAASDMLLKSKTMNNKDQQYIEHIKTASEDMNKLVQAFLILARSEREESEVSEKITLRAAANTQLEKWANEFKLKNLELILEDKGSSGEFLNAIFLDTVMSNLLRNALYYTNQGIVRIVLEANQFSIEDTGIGIPVEKQARIFDPFYRGANPIVDGFGLGLSLVQRICRHQGWRVDVKSIVPQGSIFTVTFMPISP